MINSDIAEYIRNMILNYVSLSIIYIRTTVEILSMNGASRVKSTMAVECI